MKRKFILMLTIATLCLTVAGCSSNTATSNDSASAVVESTESTGIGNADATITLGDTISVEGTGASVNNNKVTISSGGTYAISGTLSDGQIIVDSADDNDVTLVLNNVDLTCSNSAPIYVKAAKNAVIYLPSGSQNTLTDGENYVFEDASSDEPSAAVFSKDDLIIKGDGSLTVNANYNDGITGKDDLEIQGGNISITSADDGIVGKDSVTVSGGSITIDAQGDGIKSTNTEDTTKGYVSIEAGTLNITSACDGIQAETNVTIDDGDITILSGGGSVNAAAKTDNGMMNPWGQSTTQTSDDTPSTKGIKSGVNITINGGNINIDSCDDSIHTNDSVVINGGTFNISSGDDGIHADTTLDINGGDINIAKSYEGIESTTININDGTIYLTASDDGVNAAGGNDTTTMDKFSASTGTLYINGGYLYVDASGDGLDANGSIEMSGGVVIVNGPENSGNGALDYDTSFNITGGTFIAAGSSGMAQSPSSTSTQASINVFTNGSAGTLIHVEDESGNEILTFAPSKSFGSVVISSPQLQTGTTYSVYSGGSHSGTSKDGIYSNGTYTAGSEITSFALSSSVMTVTSSGATEGSAGMGGMNGGMGGGRGQKPGMNNSNTVPQAPTQVPTEVPTQPDGTSSASQNN